MVVPEDKAIGTISKYEIKTEEYYDVLPLDTTYCTTAYAQVQYKNITCRPYIRIQHCDDDKDTSIKLVEFELERLSKSVDILAYDTRCTTEYLFLNNEFWANINCIFYYIIMLIIVGISRYIKCIRRCMF